MTDMHDNYANTPIPDYIDELVPMKIFRDNFDYPIEIDIVYQDPDHPHNIFGKIYHDDAELWLHRDLAGMTLLASLIANQNNGILFELKDGLRPIEAQEKMNEAEIVDQNPQWKDLLLFTPGTGGHPRGTAIDIILLDQDKNILDCGTHFDYLTEDLQNNPAARNHQEFGDEETSLNIIRNRNLLTGSMEIAAAMLNQAIYPLQQEWWDFRMPKPYERTRVANPLSDKFLPRDMRMTDRYLDQDDPDNSPDEGHWNRLADEVHDQVQKAIRHFSF